MERVENDRRPESFEVVKKSSQRLSGRPAALVLVHSGPNEQRGQEGENVRLQEGYE